MSSPVAAVKNPHKAGSSGLRFGVFLRGASVIAGGFLVHLSLGTLYTIGNLLPYVVSYTRARSHPENLAAATGTWVAALNISGQGLTMCLGGWLEKRVGPRLSTLAGGWLMSAGVLASFFTIKVSFWLFLLSYGLVFGLGIGIAYVGPLSCAMRWMPRYKGVAGGFVVAGFGLGALFFDQVQSLYINPHNVKPDEDGFFRDKVLLDRVPFVFLILGGTYAVMQLVGSLFIVNPPHDLASRSRKDGAHKASIIKEQYKKTKRGREKQADFLKVTDGTVTPTTHESCPSDSDLSASSEEEVEKETDPLISSTNSMGNNINTQADVLQERPTDDDNAMKGTHPLRVIRTPNFYHLWVMFLLAGFAVNFISTLYKVFGLSFIDDDQFLAIVGSTSSILNCAGRIVWGLIADRFSFKFSLVFQSAVMTIFLSTFYATIVFGKSAFFIWVCVIFFCVGGNFSLFPTAMALSFGPKYMSINYGLLFTSQVSSGVVAAVLFTTLQRLLDWDGTIFLATGISLAGFLVTLAFVFRRYY